MAKGASKISGGGGSTNAQTTPEFQEAFAPGKDFESVNGVNHVSRTVSRTTQAEWDNYASQFGADPTAAENAAMYKEWDPRTDSLYGYFRTTNAMALNAQFYQNVGKTPDQIFNKRTKQGKKDVETVDTLDRMINSHTAPNDGLYYRFCNPNSLQRSYGLTDAQMKLVLDAPKMTASELSSLNASLRGSRASSPGYLSVSANRSLNAFKDPNAKQSKGYTIERRISIKKGTHGFATKGNAQESEVVFGRNFNYNFSHITVEGNHIIVHEYA